MFCQKAEIFRNNIQQGSCGFPELLSISLLSPFLPMVSRDGHLGFRGGKGWGCSFNFLQVSFPSAHVSCDLYIHYKIKETPSLKPIPAVCLTNMSSQGFLSQGHCQEQQYSSLVSGSAPILTVFCTIHRT